MEVIKSHEAVLLSVLESITRTRGHVVRHNKAVTCAAFHPFDSGAVILNHSSI